MQQFSTVKVVGEEPRKKRSKKKKAKTAVPIPSEKLVKISKKKKARTSEDVSKEKEEVQVLATDHAAMNKVDENISIGLTKKIVNERGNVSGSIDATSDTLVDAIQNENISKKMILAAKIIKMEGKTKFSSVLSSASRLISCKTSTSPSIRASRTNNDSACEKTCQKIQEMHPSMYDDSAGPTCKITLYDGSKFNDKKRKGDNSFGNGSDSDSSGEMHRRSSLVGSQYQAEIPEWNDIIPESDCQKIQEMHPSMYDDSAGPTCNLREITLYDGSKFNDKKRKGDNSFGNGSDSDSSGEMHRRSSLVGSQYQAEIPEWNDIIPESNSKWLGARVWPLLKDQQYNKNLLIERDGIGKGRQNPCGCYNPGSTECVKLHITAKQEKLKHELGPAFYIWCFDVMGEGTLKYWSELDLKKIEGLMTSRPSLSQTLFDQAKMFLSSKSKRKIVSYYYNVSLMQYRANKSRNTPDNEDPAPIANQTQKPVLLSPKKRRRR